MDSVGTPVRPKHVAAVVADPLAAKRGTRPVKPASVLRVVATLRSALGAAVKIRRLPDNAAAHVELPRTVRPKAVERTQARTAAFWAECERLAAKKTRPGKRSQVTFEIWRAVPRPEVAIWSRLSSAASSTSPSLTGSARCTR